MFFLALSCVLAGGTLVYAGIKGEGETINGTPISQAPWNLLIAPFTGGQIEASQSVGTAFDSDGNAQNVTLTSTQTVESPLNAFRIALSNFATYVRSNKQTGESV